MSTSNSISRRGFTKILGASAAYAAIHPANAIDPAAWRALNGPEKVAGVVRLSSNENPYGPSPAALKAMTDGFSLAWRYPDEYYDSLVELLSASTGIPSEHFMLGNGSGEILKVAAMAFTGPGKKLVLADPTFEAIGHHAQNNGARVVKVALDANYSHDLAKMLAAANGAG